MLLWLQELGGVFEDEEEVNGAVGLVDVEVGDGEELEEDVGENYVEDGGEVGPEDLLREGLSSGWGVKGACVGE